jgi:hypothetical protein
MFSAVCLRCFYGFAFDGRDSYGLACLKWHERSEASLFVVIY